VEVKSDHEGLAIKASAICPRVAYGQEDRFASLTELTFALSPRKELTVSSRKAVASSLELLLQPVRREETRIIVTATIEDCLRFIFILLSQLRLKLPFKATAFLVEGLVFL
jgi:hypothetical protein